MLFTNLRVGPAKEGAVCDINRGAILEGVVWPLILCLIPTVHDADCTHLRLLCGRPTRIVNCMQCQQKIVTLGVG